jgi:tRNA (guanine37-N1)-methyltransferase
MLNLNLILTEIYQDDSLISSFDSMSLFRPPVVRSAAVAAAATLDRSLFSKTIPISAARILNVKKISQHRTQLTKTKELLGLERFTNIRPDPDSDRASKGGKCFLLSPQVKPEGIL